MVQNKLQNRDGIAPELTEERRFFELYGSGKASTPDGWNDPANWKYLEDIPEEKHFGFAIGNNSNYLFIDGDHVRDPESGELVPWVAEVVKRIDALTNTYTETSLSETGFHKIADLGEYGDNFEPETNSDIQKIIAMDPAKYAKLPKAERDAVPKIELFYHARGRYVYLTGRQENGSAPARVAKDEDAAAIFSELIRIREEFHAKYSENGASAGDDSDDRRNVDDETREMILQALPYISATERETWIHVGIACSNCGLGFEVWNEWSKWDDQRKEKPCDKYDPKDAATVWKSFRDTKSRWNAGTIFLLARQGGWKNPGTNLSRRNDSKPDWMECLKTTKGGAVKNCFFNYVRIIADDPYFKRKIRENALYGRPFIKDFPWNLSDHPLRDVDISYMRAYMDREYGLSSRENIEQAVSMAAHSHLYHPIVDRLNSLEWDGIPRIVNLIPRYLGAAKTEYTEAVTRLMLNGAIMRVMKPGCKFDACIIFADTKQGTGKSSLCRFLALDDEWFNDAITDFGNQQKCYEAIRGKWIIELGEMIATKKTQLVESIKMYLSQRADDLRDPYAHYPEHRPRQCIFIGTTNKPHFLPDDKTGNRRFFPIICNGYLAAVHPLDDEEETRNYIRQCYAEALVYGKEHGFNLKLDPKFDKELQEIIEMSTPEDPLIGTIQYILDEKSEEDCVCADMIWDLIQAHNTAHRSFSHVEPSRFDLEKISDIMDLKIDGWERYRANDGRSRDSRKRFKTYGRRTAWIRVRKTVCKTVRADNDEFMNADSYDGDLPFIVEMDSECGRSGQDADRME